VLCYFEVSSKFNMNTVQNYLLLALNICRYTQTVFNRNIYTEDSRRIILIRFLIRISPVLNVMVQLLAD